MNKITSFVETGKNFTLEAKERLKADALSHKWAYGIAGGAVALVTLVGVGLILGDVAAIGGPLVGLSLAAGGAALAGRLFLLKRAEKNERHTGEDLVGGMKNGSPREQQLFQALLSEMNQTREVRPHSAPVTNPRPPATSAPARKPAEPQPLPYAQNPDFRQRMAQIRARVAPEV